MTTDKRFASLSARELQVIDLFLDGLPGKEMAHLLGISVRTVYGYKESARRKLGLRNDTELIRCAVSRGLIDEHGNKSTKAT